MWRHRDLPADFQQSWLVISDVTTTGQPIGIKKIEPLPVFASMLIRDFFYRFHGCRIPLQSDGGDFGHGRVTASRLGPRLPDRPAHRRPGHFGRHASHQRAGTAGETFLFDFCLGLLTEFVPVAVGTFGGFVL